MLRKDEQAALERRLSGQDTGKKNLEKGGIQENLDQIKQDIKSTSKPPKLQINQSSAQSSGYENQRNSKQHLGELIRPSLVERNQSVQKQSTMEVTPGVSKKNRKDTESDKKKVESPETPNKRIKKATLKVVEKQLKKQDAPEVAAIAAQPVLVEEEKVKEGGMIDEDDEESQVICTKTKIKESKQNLKRKKKTHHLERQQQKEDAEMKESEQVKEPEESDRNQER